MRVTINVSMTIVLFTWQLSNSAGKHLIDVHPNLVLKNEKKSLRCV